ncbi:MAG: insulinase family protein [Alphaproteobacteria bacterium]|nr:insulinase family protein [Alphaproteobacteria bacterium]
MLQPKLYNLSNGIPVIIDLMPASESLSVGVYIKSGSRNESDPADFGISHLLEHMALKGTKTRNAIEITVPIENVGGNINAYTGFAQTSYHATVPARYLELIVGILADVVQNPSFPADEFEREKSVVVQELRAYEDIPDAVLENHMCDAIFRGGMRHDIGGSIDSVTAMTRDQMADFYHARYGAGNSVIVLSGGGLEKHDAVLHELEKHFGAWHLGSARQYEPSEYVPALRHTQRPELSHTYFKIIWPSRPATRRNELMAQNLFLGILGSGFGSRLFQEIREKRGLVYGIGTGGMFFEDIGIATIEAQTEKAKMPETIQAVAEIIRKIKNDEAPLTAEELVRAKERVKGGLLIGLETSMRRADYFASRCIHYGGIDNMKENIKAIENVTLEQVAAAAKELLSKKPSIITLGIEHELPLSEWREWF